VHVRRRVSEKPVGFAPPGADEVLDSNKLDLGCKEGGREYIGDGVILVDCVVADQDEETLCEVELRPLDYKIAAPGSRGIKRPDNANAQSMLMWSTVCDFAIGHIHVGELD
jgi:hypothetical protein